MKRSRSDRVILLLAAATASSAFTAVRQSTQMVLTPPYRGGGIFQSCQTLDFNPRPQRKLKRQYKRKRIPQSEREAMKLKRKRQAEFEEIKDQANIFSFESLFPDPVWDDTSIQEDLYAIRKQDTDTINRQQMQIQQKKTGVLLDEEPAVQLELKSRAPLLPEEENLRLKSSMYGGSSMMRAWREPKISSSVLSYSDDEKIPGLVPPTINAETSASQKPQDPAPRPPRKPKQSKKEKPDSMKDVLKLTTNTTGKVDLDLTRMVRDRVFGYRRTRNGELQYDTSLLGQDGAVQFREGVRLGNPLKVNADKLNYLAKKELSHGKVEEAQDLYEVALKLDPRDGRAYLGMARCAQRRRDFKRAKAWLTSGIANSVSTHDNEKIPIDRGANPFLLQALGVLEERMGRLSEAEALYIAACKSRPTHAAAWVSLGLLRTRKLGQSPSAGRMCFQTAQMELNKYGLRVPAHVYTAWASLETKSDPRKARELFQKALEVDNRSSVAWLQLGCLETAQENWSAAQECFESGLKNDRRNSRILQAYAIMESKRPDSDSRKTIGLFEKALKAKPRDAGVLQAYALYILDLGDIKAARDLLRRGTLADKRHAAVWQAWGVLETRHGDAETARSIFQDGIWACAQLTGGQSGGYRCARLWQAWGVLEAQQGEVAAARRCFSRALDADARNVAAVTAWAGMEEELGNIPDARAIFERSLGQFAGGSGEKYAIWRNFELMEQRLGNVEAAQQVYNRGMRETMSADDAPDIDIKSSSSTVPALKNNEEVEFSRWDAGSTTLGREVWLNDRAIEAKVPFDMKKRNRKQ